MFCLHFVKCNLKEYLLIVVVKFSDSVGLVNLGSLYTHIGGGTQCYKAGKEVLKAGHVIVCGWTKSEPPILQILALCLQSTGVRKSPYELNLTLDDGDIKDMRCQCAAGINGKCKHSVAVLTKLAA